MNWTENQWQQFYGVLDPSQNLGPFIIEVAWDRLDRERRNRQPTSKAQLQNLLQTQLLIAVNGCGQIGISSYDEDTCSVTLSFDLAVDCL